MLSLYLLAGLIVLLPERLHFVLHHLLLLVQKVNCLCLVHVGVHHGWLVHVLLRFKLIHFFELLVLLSKDEVLMQDLAVLLRSHRHLIVVNHSLSGILSLLALWVQAYFLSDELVLLLKLVRIKIIRIVLLMSRILLLSILLVRRNLLPHWGLNRLLVQLVVLVILHWLQLVFVVVIWWIVLNVLALGTMSYTLSQKRFILPIQAVCSSAAILVVERKDRFLFDTLTSLVRDVLIIFGQHVINLSIEVLLVEHGVRF